MSEDRGAKYDGYRSVEDDQLPEESAAASCGTNTGLPDDQPDSPGTELDSMKEKILENIGGSHGAAEKKVRQDT